MSRRTNVGVAAAGLQRARVFGEAEAWRLFRAAAVGEAVGWTLLIAGLLIKRFVMHGNNDAVAIAGRIHGTLFLVYLAVSIIIGPSLRWRPAVSLAAAAASVPPYGSLVFEKLAARRRQHEALRARRQLAVRALIFHRGKLFVIQPRESVFWLPPGGIVPADETAEHALKRLVAEQTGITPQLGPLALAHEDTTDGGVHQLTLFFHVTNPGAFARIQARATTENRSVDELAFIIPTQTPDLRPAFLQTAALGPLAAVAKQATGPKTSTNQRTKT